MSSSFQRQIQREVDAVLTGRKRLSKQPAITKVTFKNPERKGQYELRCSTASRALPLQKAREAAEDLAKQVQVRRSAPREFVLVLRF